MRNLKGQPLPSSHKSNGNPAILTHFTLTVSRTAKTGLYPITIAGMGGIVRDCSRNRAKSLQNSSFILANLARLR